MRLHIFSDLHEEFRGHQQRDLKGRLRKKGLTLGESIQKHVEENGNDGVCILAGDICPVDPRFVDSAKLIHEAFTSWFENVIFVPGNHEFYGTSIREGMDILRSWQHPRWHLLQPGLPVTIEGQRFMGGTLWYDGNHERWRQKYINDFRRIDGVEAAYFHNQEFVRYTCETMKPDDIIVSHHLPSAQSTPRQFADSEINCFFVSDQEHHILQRKPKLWVHGHTHSPTDYMLGETRVYANPHGYPSEYENPKFWDRVCIEVPDHLEPRDGPEELFDVIECEACGQPVFGGEACADCK
jgi:calcineurin-like phosphoesterase family protein